MSKSCYWYYCAVLVLQLLRKTLLFVIRMQKQFVQVQKKLASSRFSLVMADRQKSFKYLLNTVPTEFFSHYEPDQELSSMVFFHQILNQINAGKLLNKVDSISDVEYLRGSF